VIRKCLRHSTCCRAGSSTGSTPLDAALEYAYWDWPVFPVHAAHGGVCTCRKGAKCNDTAKHPRTRHGFSPRQAGIWLNGLVIDGFLIREKEADRRRRKAAFYHYIGGD
jgi:hypothetical protein